MKKLNKRQNADPAFRAAASKRMKRQRADPAFNALHRQAMQRVNASPESRKANRERMIRRNADPAFRAKQSASVSIPAKTRAAIIAALKADPNARRVADRTGGASYNTVQRIAKAEGIELRRPPLTAAQIKRARRRIDGGEKQYIVARSYGVDPSTLSRYLARTARVN